MLPEQVLSDQKDIPCLVSENDPPKRADSGLGTRRQDYTSIISNIDRGYSFVESRERRFYRSQSDPLVAKFILGKDASRVFDLVLYRFGQDPRDPSSVGDLIDSKAKLVLSFDYHCCSNVLPDFRNAQGLWLHNWGYYKELGDRQLMLDQPSLDFTRRLADGMTKHVGELAFDSSANIFPKKEILGSSDDYYYSNHIQPQGLGASVTFEARAYANLGEQSPYAAHRQGLNTIFQHLVDTLPKADGKRPAVMITEAIHGNEYLNFADRLATDILLLPSARRFIEDLSGIIYVVPIVNPWGYSNWVRQNSNCVDLNRDFPFRVEALHHHGRTQSEVDSLLEFLGDPSR
jgi:hypothetical protein